MPLRPSTAIGPRQIAIVVGMSRSHNATFGTSPGAADRTHRAIVASRFSPVRDHNFRVAAAPANLAAIGLAGMAAGRRRIPGKPLPIPFGTSGAHINVTAGAPDIFRRSESGCLRAIPLRIGSHLGLHSLAVILPISFLLCFALLCFALLCFALLRPFFRGSGILVAPGSSGKSSANEGEILLWTSSRF